MCIFLGEVDEDTLDDNDKDEKSEIEAAVSGSEMTAKDGTQSAETPTSELQAGRHNIVRQRCGPNRNTNIIVSSRHIQIILITSGANN